jgi:hypothetical protein
MPQKPSVARVCETCGRSYLITKAEAKRGRGKNCSKSCASKHKYSALPIGARGPYNLNWKGGATKSTKGYWYINMPGHPRAMKSGYVKRADIVLEASLGRPLRPGEIAHHVDDNKENDAPENLRCMMVGPHSAFHRYRQIAKRREMETPR